VKHRERFTAGLRVSVAAAAIAALAPRVAGAETDAELYTRYLGNAPSGFETDWSDGFNGITHDDSHWYLSQSKYLYRAPLARSLDRDLKRTGAPYIRLEDLPPLENYGHFGDISYYESGGVGHVLVPVDAGVKAGSTVEGSPVPRFTYEKLPAKLAIFRADRSLRFIAATDFPGQLGDDGDGQAGFVAVDGRGRVYSARNNGLCTHLARARARGANPLEASCLRRYSANWSALADEGGRPRAFALRFEREIRLLDDQGKPILLENMQGGAVAHGDRVIYLLNGLNCSANEGVHAFDLETGRMRASSTTDTAFRFEHRCGGKRYEEPEGLTVWDLDGVPNPDGIRGQLHVVLMKNQLDANNLWFKHYTTRTFVRDHRTESDRTQVRDHRSANDASKGAVHVRDHRSLSGGGEGAANVRDHR
jgi:hypothetical protein